MSSKHACARILGLGIASWVLVPAAWALTGTQVGASGKTYASAVLECGVSSPERSAGGCVLCGLWSL